MDEVDRRLREAGEAWRDRQPEPPPLDVLAAALEHGPRQRPSGALVFAAAVVLAVVAVAGIGILPRLAPTDVGTGPSSEPTTPSAEVVSAEATDGVFRLVFEMPKTTWNADETITGQARLGYLGPGTATIGHAGAGPIAFGLTESGGTVRLGPGFRLSCAVREVSADRPIVAPLSKSGGWDPGDPNASFYDSFFADPLYRLPPGDWEITAVAEFSEPGCGGEQKHLQTSLRIRVIADAATSDPEPATAEHRDGPYRLVFEIPKGTWNTEESIIGEARLEFDGPAGWSVYGSGGGPFGFTATEIGGSRQMGPPVFSTDCAAHLAESGTLRSGLAKTFGFTTEDPDAAFYRDFLNDPLYRLPPGEWEITALALFDEATCGGVEHRLQASLRIRVIPSGPAETEPARAEDSDGPYRLVFEFPKATWTTEESISAFARLEYDGAGTVALSGSGSGVLLFDVEEVGGTVRFPWGADGDCSSYEISSDRPITTGLLKFASWGSDDPNAALYRSFVADPLYRLPAGDWRFTVIASFYERGCERQLPELRATLDIRVVEPS